MNNNFILFLISLIACLVMLYIERLIGINWDFHPDAITYLEDFREFSESLIAAGPISYFNNSYYLISYLVDGSFHLLFIINIISYAITNILIKNCFADFWTKTYGNYNFKYYLYLAIILIAPYRLHLSIHILKDTLIILLLTYIISQNRRSYFAWIALLMVRVFSFFYIFSLLNKKKIYILFLIFLGLYILNPLSLVDRFINYNDNLEMNFREFDRVPNFSELGVFGIFMRALIWPFFLLSGTFFITSPSLSYLPIALSSIIIQGWCFKVLKSYGFTIGVYFSMALIATVVNGFTSYLRYCYPLFIIMPLLIMRFRLDGAIKVQR
jgi:hypothetical protein